MLDIDKAAPKFVTAAVQKAFGPDCSVECPARSDKHESFESFALSTAVDREVSTTAGTDTSAGFIRVAATEKVVFSYNDQRRLEKGNPEPRGPHVGVAPPADTAQVRSICGASQG